jgi:hypothetical protein
MPGEPIPVSQPNKGSVQGRKEKKRIKQRKAFIMVTIPFPHSVYAGVL